MGIAASFLNLVSTKQKSAMKNILTAGVIATYCNQFDKNLMPRGEHALNAAQRLGAFFVLRSLEFDLSKPVSETYH